MFRFPFGTMHELNLDWFLQEWENYKQEWADAQAGIDNALQGEIDRVEDAMTDLYDARDAAIQAKDDAETAANSVIADAAQAGADALKSEGYALGEQDGTPVGAGSPYYQQNAKYYKVEAGTYRYLSEAYAKGEMGGSPVAPGEAGYQDNAKYYKGLADADAAATAADRVQTGLDRTATGNDALATAADRLAVSQDKDDTDLLKDAANAAALRAEGFSSGTQNGTPVGSDSPYYENNAAWYYGNTANIDGENAQKMISAHAESSMTVVSAYSAGDWVRVAGVLYEVTANVAAGGTLVVGTNCQTITVEQYLVNTINDKINSALIQEPEEWILSKILCPDYQFTANGRRITKKNTYISSEYISSSTAKVAVNLTGSEANLRTGFADIENIPAIITDCVPIEWMNIINGNMNWIRKAYSSYTGSVRAILQFVWYSIDSDNNITKISAQYFTMIGKALGAWTAMTAPAGATHFAIYQASAGAGARYEGVFTLRGEFS